MTRISAASTLALVYVALIAVATTVTAQTPKWEATNGPYGAVCQDIVQTPSGYFLLSDERNGVWRSTDGCAHWQQSSSGLAAKNVYALALADDGSVLAGTHYGMFRSSDEGLSWEDRSGGMTGSNIKDIVVLSDGTVLAAAWGGGIYRSTDAGEAWKESSSGLTQLSMYCLRRNASDHIFAGSFGDGVFRSTDKGLSWTALPLGGYIYDIGIRPDGVLLAISHNMGVFQSTDNGDTWVKSNDGLPAYSGQGFAARSNSEILFGAAVEKGMYRSSDGGSTWSAWNDGYSSTLTRGICQMPNGDCFAMTYGDGVYRLPKDSSRWTQCSAGLQGAWIYALESVSDSIVFAGGYGGVWVSRDRGDSWSHVTDDLSNMRVEDLLYSAQTLFAAGYAEGVRKSTDLGGHWIPVHTGSSSQRPRCLAVDSIGTLYCGYDGDGIYSSTDHGDTWQSASNGLSSLRVHALCADGADMLYASTNDGVFASANRGATWSPAATGLPSTRCYALCAGNGFIFAGVSTGIFRSSDQGAHWTQVGTGTLPSRVHHAVKIDGSGNIYAGGAGSVRISTDNGETWQIPGSGILSGDIYDFAFHAQSHVFAATEGNGVHRLPAAGSAAEITIESAPEGRMFTIDGASYSSAQTFTWQQGSTHTIGTTQVQDGAPGIRYVWKSWSNGEEMTHAWTVPAVQAQSITAYFDTEFQLTTSAEPGGTVLPETGWHASGAQVQLLATPAAGYAFDRWEGTGQGAYSGSDNPATITLRNPVSESAVFRQVSGIPTVRLRPETVVLHQSAPNPVRDVAVIPFSLSRAQPVKLVLTDILGHIVKHVVEGKWFAGGKHQVVVDVSELPAGVYFYRLMSPDGVSTRSMVLQK